MQDGRNGRRIVEGGASCVMKTFWTLFGIGSAVFLVLLGFFLAGLGDRSVSSFNIAIWLPLVGVPAAVLWGGLRLKAAGRPGLAAALLALLAVPGLLVGGWVLLLLVLFEMHPGAYR